MTTRPFSQQFSECKATGLTDKTEIVSLASHPEFLPAFPKEQVVEAIRNGIIADIEFILCGRFGGRCSSGHPDCRRLRSSN